MERTCSKCSGRPVEGFLLDRGTYARGMEWVEGKAQYSIWVGVKTRGRRKHPVECHRCARCGHLELYAPG